MFDTRSISSVTEARSNPDRGEAGDSYRGCYERLRTFRAVVGLKLRVLAKSIDSVGGLPWVYCAAAYRQDGRANEPSWTCDHVHEDALAA